MRQIPHRSLTVLAILALLMVMLGCQGLSSAKSDSDPPPPAAQLTASSPSLSFGTVAVGTIQVLPETVTNTGTASVSLTSVSVTGTGFTISGLTLPMSLAAGQSTSFNVVFQPPSVVTAATGNVALANTGTNSVLGIPLAGSGATPPALTASPSGYSFGTSGDGQQCDGNRNADEFWHEQRDDFPVNRDWSRFRRQQFRPSGDPGSEPIDEVRSDVLAHVYSQHGRGGDAHR